MTYIILNPHVTDDAPWKMFHDYIQKINHGFIMFVNIYISGTFHTKRILVIYLYQNAPNNPLNK